MKKNKNTFIKYLLIITAVLINFNSLSQNTDNELDAFINEANYDEAIQLATALLKHSPNDATLNFKLGYCYLNTILRKEKSIPFLIKSVEIFDKTNPKSNEAIESKFQLAKAYHLNYQFEKSIDILNKLKHHVKNKEVIDAINYESSQCESGLKLSQNPIETQITILNQTINSEYSDHSPVISADETVLIFTSRRKRHENEKLELDGQYNEDIYISYFENQNWTKPISISENINTEAHEASIGISPDGQQLFIYRDVEGGTILTSYLTGDKWSVPVDLGPHINTRFRETHASLSADGKYLYFTSDRPGGYGSLDIYISEKQANGEWGKAENLGAGINTEKDEEGPFIHHDGISLYFSSKGHNTIGGYDIFISKKNEFGTWAEAENLGYPANTVGDDAFYVLTPDGKRAYYSSIKSDGFGNSDIYLMGLPEAEEKSLAVIKGKVEACDYDIENVQISVFDSESSEIEGYYKPNSKTGKYLFVLNKGKNYKAVYQINDNDEHIENFYIGEDSDFQIIYKTVSLVGDKNCDNIIGRKKEIAINKDIVEYDNTITYETDVTYVEDILFKVNSFQLDYFKDNLIKLSNYLKENPEAQIELIGYSDTQGPESYNLKISDKRAKIVANFLISQGVNKKQISYKGNGVKNQLTKNKYKDGSYIWQSLPYNRRVEFKIINDPKQKLKFRKIKIPAVYDINPNNKEIENEIARLDSVFTIQLGAYSKPISQKYFKEIENLQMFFTGNLYKYSTGEFKTLKKAKKELEKIIELGFIDAYIRKISEYFPAKLKKE
ncbi:MAG: PD40 domain-containing protein [Bacteroidales bacterium]|nr:PD40 domain-containing protein [Bacteroidales bacterium]MBN2758507.1 PD40 domain-containing protein [Bacteroidales bacterium]